MSKTNLEKLVTKFPEFVVKNRHTVAKHIPLKNGEVAQVQGSAVARIATEDLMQLPNPTEFRYMEPTVLDLEKGGFYETGEEEEKKTPPASGSGEPPAPPAPDAGKNDKK